MRDIPRTKEETSARAEMETSPTGVFRFSGLLNGLRSAADENIQYRIDGGKLVAVDQIAWFTTFNHDRMMKRLRTHRSLAGIIKTAWIIHAVANAEIA
ncbi:hypothetical protein SLS58_006528 [Diplodia intermedia]|uniref:BRCT domain-containing protein n=1 Tax=Diplodia intermedia TaxID=856260 RepID=A0ABR3TNN0_9PEZI